MQLTDIVVLGVMLTAHLMVSIYAYLDAPDHGMESRRWGMISFIVPMFGFFAYLFEKEERTKDPSDREDQFSDGVFEVHESRAEDVPFGESSGEYKYGPEDDE
jgi:hypothetical protein